ncbi:hypothetical protein [Proteus sp. NMG38-2]|uniref:hypothetical protein n=1 Tax=Proteus sp. NMG38-2 TaxID=2883107 RepID=UPI001D09FD57|nr:hypothetical protein [Proteus sp. NMG38-2]UDN37231.1 hypothetical protein LG402_06160 [Proteus sp. NMG38-2]
MNKYILSFLSILIISFYSLILLLSIDGFKRNSKINNLLNELPSFFTPTYSFVFLFIIMIILNTIAFSLFKQFRMKISTVIIPSFFISLLIYFTVILIPNLNTYLYDKYIFIFYNGVIYNGEERTQQVFSFMFRIFTIISVFSIILISFLKK